MDPNPAPNRRSASLRPPQVQVTRRILFLDDDPERAQDFLDDWPEAIWVETVEQCLERLASGEPWDEVHLDHDLGGEVFVEGDREDCGMAIVRWICDEPRLHLQPTQFVIHTHNPNAAFLMSTQLGMMGHRVVVRPFGSDPPRPQGSSPFRRFMLWLSRFSR